MAVYPSIYRAKATQATDTTITAYIPQVFGDTPVVINDFLGPPAPGMGWVFFQAGNPEHPVWTTRVASPNDADWSNEVTGIGGQIAALKATDTALKATDAALQAADAALQAADVSFDARVDALEVASGVAPAGSSFVITPAQAGARFDDTAQARFGNVNEASKRVGFLAAADGTNLVISKNGGTFGLWERTADGTSYQNHANFKYGDSAVYPWRLTGLPHGGSCLTPWANTGSSDYTLLSLVGSTYLNASSGQTIYFRIGNNTVAQSTGSTFSVLNTLSTNAIGCTTLGASGAISGASLALGTGGITCGAVNVGTGNISCGALYPSTGIGTGAGCSFGSVHSLGFVQSHKDYQGGDWTNWGIYSKGGGLTTIGFHNGTYASGWRTHTGSGDQIEAINWNQSDFVPLYAKNFPVASTITIKRDVRSLRPERERNDVRLDPASDTVDQPDVMALRPVAFRYKTPMQRINPDTGKGEPEPEDTILGRESRREYLGLIAEEVQHVLPSAVNHDVDGKAMGVEYSQITVALLDHVQRLTDEIATLRYRVAELEGEQ